MKENVFGLKPTMIRNAPKKQKADAGSMLAGGAQGALSGAAMGTPFGFPGQVIGGVVGGLYGLYEGSQGKKGVANVTQGMKEYQDARSTAAKNQMAEMGKKLKPVAKAVKKSA